MPLDVPVVRPVIQQRLGAAGRSNVAMTMAVMAVSFIAQVVIARSFGPGGLGEYNGTTLFIVVASTIANLGLPLAITQRVAEHDEARSGRAGMVAGSALTVSVAIAAVAGVIAAWLWPSFLALTNMVRAESAAGVGVACGLMIVQYYTVSVLLGRLDFRWTTIVTASQPAAVIVAVLWGSTGGSQLAVVGCFATGAVAIVRLVLNGQLPAFDLAEVRALFRRAAPGVSVLYVTVLTGWIDRLIATFVLGPVGLGTFVAASYFTEAAIRLPRSAGAFAVAAYARFTEDAAGARRLLDSHLRIQAAYFIVLGALLIGGAAGLLQLAFGPAFRVATTPLQLMAMALLPMGVSSALAQSATGSREPFLRPSYLGLVLVLQVIADLTGAIWLAVAGMALATLGVSLIASVAYARRAAERVHSPAAYRTLARIAGAAAPSYAAALLIGRLPLGLPLVPQLALTVAIAGGISFATLIGEPERRLLLRVLRPGRGGLPAPGT